MKIKTRFNLVKEGINSSYVPLCVLGEAMYERKTLHKLREYGLIGVKQHDHPPGEKLMDAFLLILSGYGGLNQINTTLRSDLKVGESWHREAGLAEQSNISRTLDACDEKAVAGLEKLNEEFWRSHSRLENHDRRRALVVDLDLTPVPAGRKAEGSTKGCFGKKTNEEGN